MDVSPVVDKEIGPTGTHGSGVVGVVAVREFFVQRVSASSLIVHVNYVVVNQNGVAIQLDSNADIQDFFVNLSAVALVREKCAAGSQPFAFPKHKLFKIRINSLNEGMMIRCLFYGFVQKLFEAFLDNCAIMV